MAKILLVEDNELNRDMLSRRLRRRGYELSIAVDGAEAIAIASAQPFDLILMDMSLPVMDGWEATRRLKAQPHTKKVPIIALTAHAMRGDRDQALAAGCDDYDTKPIDLKRLLSKIKSFLSSEQRLDTVDSPSPRPTIASESSTASVVPIKPVTPITPPTLIPINSTAPEPPVAPTNPDPVLPISADIWMPSEQSTVSKPLEDDPWMTPSRPDVVEPVPSTQADTAQVMESVSPIQAEVSSVTDVSEISGTAAAERKKNIFSGLPILVVDDNEDNRDMLSRRLTRRGYQAVVVESGEAALDYIATHTDVALVLLDIMMPGIDGIETLQRIRETYSRNQMPVLMVTAKAQSDDMVRAFELGANDYITKPIDFAVTLARVETQLAIVKAAKTTSSAPVHRVASPPRPVQTPSKPPERQPTVTNTSTAVTNNTGAAAANISVRSRF